MSCLSNRPSNRRIKFSRLVTILRQTCCSSHPSRGPNRSALLSRGFITPRVSAPSAIPYGPRRINAARSDLSAIPSSLAPRSATGRGLPSWDFCIFGSVPVLEGIGPIRFTGLERRKSTRELRTVFRASGVRNQKSSAICPAHQSGRSLVRSAGNRAASGKRPLIAPYLQSYAEAK